MKEIFYELHCPELQAIASYSVPRPSGMNPWADAYRYNTLLERKSMI
jgi:hypothetical protein